MSPSFSDLLREGFSTAEQMDLSAEPAMLERGDEPTDQQAESLVQEHDSTPLAVDHAGTQHDPYHDDDTDERDPREHDAPVQLISDQADDIATRAMRGGSASDGSDGDLLPRSSFRLDGVSRQPQVKLFPPEVIARLRTQIETTATRELKVTPDEAREFASRLSQNALVLAFLLAQLDLPGRVDPATRTAIALFQVRDPLLGSAVSRLDELSEREAKQAGTLQMLRKDLAEIRGTTAVLEQALAYSIADRTENFLRGSQSTHDAPIGHKEVVFMRDRMRDAARKQLRIDADKAGRPIR